MKKILSLLIMIICLGLIVTGCVKEKTNNKLVGKYKLKKITFYGETYNPERLKNDLGRSIKLEMTKDKKVTITTIYYSIDGKSSASVEQFNYDDDSFKDPEVDNEKFYTYTFNNNELTVKNISEDEVKIFIKE